MEAKYEKLLGIIIEETKPFEASSEKPLFFLRVLQKKGFSEDEINGLVNRLKKEKVIVQDSVVGDGEFDRVVEIDPAALLKVIPKAPSAN